MLAIISSGGKQYKVHEGDFISVEKLSYNVGESIEVNEVLAIENDGQVVFGTPLIDNAKVIANVVDQKRRDTVIIFKKSRRKNYRRKNGHRQPVTILKIESINQ